MCPSEDGTLQSRDNNDRRLLVLLLGIAALAAWFRALAGGPPVLYAVAVAVFVAAVRMSGRPKPAPHPLQVVAVEPARLPEAAPALPLPAVEPVSAQPTVAEAPSPEQPADVAPEDRVHGFADPTQAAAALLDAFAPAAPLAVHIWIRDETSGSMRRIAAAGGLLPEPHPLDLDDDPVGVAAGHRSPCVSAVATVRLGDETHTMWRHAVPFEAGETAAVVVVDTVPAQQPGAGEIGAVLAVWTPVLSSVVSDFLAGTERTEGRVLLEAIATLAVATTAPQVLDIALDAAMRIAGATTGSVMLADPERPVLRMAVTRGLPAALADTEVPFGEGVSGWVAVSGQPSLVEDMPGRNEGRLSRSRSSMCVPIGGDRKVLGVLSAGCRDYPGARMGPRLDALVLLGRQVAIALDALSPEGAAAVRT